MAREARDASRLELAAQLDAYSRVLEWHQARQELDDGDVRSATAIERGELDSDGSGAQDDRRRRHAVHLQRLIAREDRLTVRGNPRELFRARARGDDDRPRLHRHRVAGWR